MNRKLIITADDYGYTELIDQAILGAARSGRITAVSAFANYDLVELKAKIRKLKEDAPAVSIGLHLSLTSGSPLTNATSLMKKVRGKWIFKRPKDIVLKNMDLNETRIEIIAQLNQMRAATNGQIDHLSCHHNILYLMPELFNLLLEIAESEHLPVRTPRNLISLSKFSEVSKLNPALIPLYLEHAFQAMNFENLMLALKAVGENNVSLQENSMVQKGISRPSYFLIHHYGNADINVFKTTYDNIGDNETCEQIMHLAMDSTDFDMRNFPNGINKRYLKGRNEEFVLLMSNANGNLLANIQNNTNAIDLVSYS